MAAFPYLPKTFILPDDRERLLADAKAQRWMFLLFEIRHSVERFLVRPS